MVRAFIPFLSCGATMTISNLGESSPKLLTPGSVLLLNQYHTDKGPNSERLFHISCRGSRGWKESPSLQVLLLSLNCRDFIALELPEACAQTLHQKDMSWEYRAFLMFMRRPGPEMSTMGYILEFFEMPVGRGREKKHDQQLEEQRQREAELGDE